MSLSHIEEMRLVKAVEHISESLKSIDKSLKTVTKYVRFVDKVNNGPNDDAEGGDEKE